MKKHILLLLVISFLSSSCEKKSVIDSELDFLGIKPEEFKSIDSTFYENKVVKLLRFYNKNEYIDVSFYESGKKKSIGLVKENQCHDEYIDWYENGQQRWVRNYFFGKLIGKSINYQENGNFEKQFDTDKNETTDYWGNGNPKFKYIPNILQYYYYSNGNLFEQFDIIKEEEYLVKLYNENGKMSFSGKYESGFLYKDNKKYTGKITCYFDTGKISHYEDLVKGIINGKFYAYYGNGNLKFEGEYGNEKEIYYKCYYENGKVNFIRDRKNKTFTQWDEKGNLIK